MRDAGCAVSSETSGPSATIASSTSANSTLQALAQRRSRSAHFPRIRPLLGVSDTGDHEPLAHFSQLPFQLVDLVPQPGSGFELQVARGVLHLVGEVLDQPRQLV